jgi:hypothetical protein
MVVASVAMKCGYLVEDGYQHAFPVLALLRVRRAPVFTTGSQIATRFRAVTDVIVGPIAELAKAMAARELDVVFTTSQNFDPDELRRHAPRLRVVHIGHGESDKSHGAGHERRYVFDPINERFDLMLLATHEHARLQVNANRELVGYLRHDRLVADGLAERAPERWILWAPAYARHSAIEPWLDAVVAATDRLGARLVIHLHPFSARIEPHVVRRVQAAVLAAPHVRLARVLDLAELMARCELMLGDVSSASWDWLMFDRPIVFLDHAGLDVPAEKAVFSVGPVAAPGDDVTAMIGAELAAPAARSAQRRAALAARFFQLDGHAAERVFAVTERWWRDRWTQ